MFFRYSIWWGILYFITQHYQLITDATYNACVCCGIKTLRKNNSNWKYLAFSSSLFAMVTVCTHQGQSKQGYLLPLKNKVREPMALPSPNLLSALWSYLRHRLVLVCWCLDDCDPPQHGSNPASGMWVFFCWQRHLPCLQAPAGPTWIFILFLSWRRSLATEFWCDDIYYLVKEKSK